MGWAISGGCSAAEHHTSRRCVVCGSSILRCIFCVVRDLASEVATRAVANIICRERPSGMEV